MAEPGGHTSCSKTKHEKLRCWKAENLKRICQPINNSRRLPLQVIGIICLLLIQVTYTSLAVWLTMSLYNVLVSLRHVPSRRNNLLPFDNNTQCSEKKLEITCHDGKPDGMLRVERRRYGSAPDVSRGVSDRRMDT